MYDLLRHERILATACIGEDPSAKFSSGDDVPHPIWAGEDERAALCGKSRRNPIIGHDEKKLACEL